MNTRFLLALLLSVFLWGNSVILAQSPTGKRPMTFEDVMKFRALDGITLSGNGSWLGYIERPDRGDPTARLQSLEKNALGKQTYTIERGTRVNFSRDAAWAAVTVAPKFLIAEKAKPDNRPDNALHLIPTASGKLIIFENVGKFALSENSAWIAVHFTKNRKEPKDTTKAKTTPKDSIKAGSGVKDSLSVKKDSSTAKKAAPPKDKKPDPGTTLLLRNLASGEEVLIPFVKDFVFDSLSTALAYTTFDSTARGSIAIKRLSGDKATFIADSSARGIYTHPTWHQTKALLAFCAASVSTTNIISAASLKVWNGETPSNTAQNLINTTNTPQSWTLPSKNTLTWTRDGKRLGFGFKPEEIHKAVTAPENDVSADTLDADLFNSEKILKSAEIDVWKWNDDYTNIHQKKLWETAKDRTFTALYDFDTQKTTPLASRDMPSVVMPQSPTAAYALGRADAPHRKKITWDGSYEDLYAVNLQTAEAKRVAENVQYNSYISPNGQCILYYSDKHWFLHDIAQNQTRNVTEKMPVKFWDESDDHPAEKPPYGFAGWVVEGSNDAAFLLYDKFDIWQFSVNPSPAQAGTSKGKNSTEAAESKAAYSLTSGEGRKQNTIFRAEVLDTNRKFYQNGAMMLLSAQHDEKKHIAYFAANIGKMGVRKLFENTAGNSYGAAKAEGSPTLVFRQSSFTTFPDLWLTDTLFTAPLKITNLQQQIDSIAWGSAELVEWKSTDKKPLKGILIKPANYEKGKRYPTLIYYYEILSETLYGFRQPRFSSAIMPSFFASNGYAVFIPDIVYQDGLPGQSALKCIAPGAQKLVDMGIADPKAIGIQGHSWGGYQSLYMITQTNMFKAAVAGAPVANMTSAYGGIRYGTGLARMFQYERSQSRIGASLWEKRDLYLNNSPLFFADRISTPLVMMFGDEDDAVPFTQGIEMYLAMRRLNKEAYLLQYRKEPHNPRKFANRYDYAIKMKDFFDYHLKGTQPTEWIKSGLQYRGR